MRHHPIRSLLGLTLAPLLLLPALPAAAERTPPTITLDLRAALEAQGSELALAVEPFEAAAAAAAEPPAIDASELRAEAWALDEDAEEPAAARAEARRGVGRWLKKHWWVPVLAAVALGVALDDDDNDASGEDD